MTRLALLVAVAGVAVLLLTAAIYIGATKGGDGRGLVPRDLPTRAQVPSTHVSPTPRTTERKPEPLPTEFEPDVPVADPAIEPMQDVHAVLAAADVTAELTEHVKMLADGGSLWTIPVAPGYVAADVWEQFRDAYPQTGWWPLMVTDLTFYRIGPQGIPVPPDWESAPLDGKRWLEDRYRDVVVEYDEEPQRGPMPDIDPADESYDWADAWDAVGEDYDRILLVPARAPWLVPAALRWSGATNYDEDGFDLAHVLRRWYGRWSAEPVALDEAELTLRVGDPPVDESAALRVALEAFLMCTDSVNQGAGSVDTLATAMALPLWRFWWD